MIISREQIESYLFGSLTFSASNQWEDSLLLAKGFEVYRRLCGLGLNHLPFFLVFDLYLLARFGNSFSFSDRTGSGEEGDAILAYESYVLNRITQEYQVQELIELIDSFQVSARMSGRDVFEPRVERVTYLLAQRLGENFPRHFEVNPAHLRGVQMKPLTAEKVKTYRDAWYSHPGVTLWPSLVQDFVQRLQGLSEGVGVMDWETLVGPEDLFEIDKLEALDKEYLRMRARYLIQVKEALPRMDPHDVDLSKEQCEVETCFVDETYVPTGGFTQISNRGTFESLVPSELVYVGEGGADGFDLFDLRYTEGEMLYFMRDSGQLMRKRRKVHFLVDLRHGINVKYSHLPHQTGTLVFGLILALVRDLTEMFSKDALGFHIGFVVGSKPHPSVAEDSDKWQEVLGVLLSSLVRKGLLTFSKDSSADLKGFGSLVYKSYVVGLTTKSYVADAWSTKAEALRSSSSPLFSSIVSLDMSEPCKITTVIQPDLLGESFLLDLKKEILQSIMTIRPTGGRDVPKS